MKDSNKVLSYNPLVSIIIPVYNGDNYLKEAIDSAINQTYKNIEIIVVNDGSIDETEKIALSYGNKIRYFKKENGGVSTALNFALKEMKGEYFSWLSHDDIYYPTKIADAINLLNEVNDENVIIFSDYEYIDENSKLIRSVKLNHNLILEKPKYIFVHGLINGLSLLIPKTAFDDFGDFDVNMKAAQDYYKWYEFSKKYKYVHLEKILVQTRVHSKQSTGHSLEYFSESDQVRIMFVEDLTKEDILSLEKTEMIFFEKLFDKFKDSKYFGYKKYLFDKITEMKNNAIEKMKQSKIAVIDFSKNHKNNSMINEQSLKNIEILDKLVNQDFDYVTFVNKKDVFDKNKIELQILNLILYENDINICKYSYKEKEIIINSDKLSFNKKSIINFVDLPLSSVVIGHKLIPEKIEKPSDIYITMLNYLKNNDIMVMDQYLFVTNKKVSIFHRLIRINKIKKILNMNLFVLYFLKNIKRKLNI